MSTKVILQYNSTIYMVLRRYPINIGPLDLPKVRQELLNHLTALGDPASHTWGYFPELNPDQSEYPYSQKTLEILRLLFPKNLRLDPAFIRLATEEPKSTYGGLHIDVSPGIAHQKEYMTGEILRILINIGDKPRLLKYCDLPLEVAEKTHNLKVDREQYKPLKLPEDILEELSIPPIEKDALYVLEFISSKIIHAGITNQAGHFLASFGGVNSTDQIQDFFQQ